MYTKNVSLFPLSSLPSPVDPTCSFKSISGLSLTNFQYWSNTETGLILNNTNIDLILKHWSSINNEVKHLVRTAYITCRAQYKMKMLGPLLKNCKNFKMVTAEHQTLSAVCIGRMPMKPALILITELSPPALPLWSVLLKLPPFLASVQLCSRQENHLSSSSTKVSHAAHFICNVLATQTPFPSKLCSMQSRQSTARAEEVTLPPMSLCGGVRWGKDVAEARNMLWGEAFRDPLPQCSSYLFPLLPAQKI